MLVLIVFIGLGCVNEGSYFFGENFFLEFKVVFVCVGSVFVLSVGVEVD